MCSVERSLCGPVAYSLYYFLIWVCSNGNWSFKTSTYSNRSSFNVTRCPADLKPNVISSVVPHNWDEYQPSDCQIWQKKWYTVVNYNSNYVSTKNKTNKWCLDFFRMSPSKISIMDDKSQRLPFKWIIIRILSAHSGQVNKKSYLFF